MSAPSASIEAEPVLLIIADISGYTRFMTANARTLSHSQTVITELVETIIREIELPIEVAKIEGDAVFLFCRRASSVYSWADTRRVVSEKLLAFFEQFNRKVRELSESTICTCSACTHIKSLRLKLIVHSGEALFHRVMSFQELAGVDVILVHRLLKNSVEANQYLLLTEAARRDLELPAHLNLVPGTETYADLGSIDTLAYLPRGSGSGWACVGTQLSPVLTENKSDSMPSFKTRFTCAWRLYRRLWFAPLKGSNGVRQTNHGQSEEASTSAGRAGFAILTLLLTPLMLPVGACFVVIHALNRGIARQHTK